MAQSTYSSALFTAISVGELYTRWGRYQIETAGRPKLAEEGCNDEPNICSCYGVCWQSPLVPLAKIQADAFAVGCEIRALPAIILPLAGEYLLTEFHALTGFRWPKPTGLILMSCLGFAHRNIFANLQPTTATFAQCHIVV